MQHIEVLDSGLIYRNPKPHLWSRHAYFPSILEIAPGQLVAGFDLGPAFEAIDVRSFVSRSSDGGKSWSEPRQVFDPGNEKPVSTSCRLNKVGANEIVGLACMMDRSRTEEGLANPQTDGFVRTEFALVRSTDGGASFASPQPLVPAIDWHQFEICSPIIPTQTGRWLAPTAVWPDWAGRSPYGPKALVLISDDRGKTWPRAVDVMNRREQNVGFFEQKIVTLSDGRLLAVCWVIDLNAKKNLPNHFTLSTSNAEQFDPPIATPLLGETCTPVALDDNHVLCIYRRMDKKGLWAHLAKVQGTHWKPVSELPLWGTNQDAHDTSQNSLLAQMSTLRFGCPAVTRLSDGHVLAAFWCVEDSVSNIRWFKLRVQ